MSSVTITASYIDDLIDVCILGRKAVGLPRAPVHFTLLVDVSGSMSGARITEVICTIHGLLDLMDPMDSISIIAYHSAAITVLNTVTIGHDRSALHAAADTLTPLGSTNLQVGLEAIRDLSSPPSAVFLLTDGYINDGITLPGALMSLARTILPPDTPLHTLGYGSEHNQSMLRDMSLRTHASYTYAESNEIIPTALGNIFGSITSTVGHATRLMIPAGYTCLEMSYMAGDPHISIGHLINEKPHHVVFRKTDAGASLPAELLFHWSNESGDHVEQVVPTAPSSPLDVTEQMLRATSAKTLSDATDLILRRDLEGAIARLTELKVALDSSPVATRLLIIQLRAQVDGMVEDLRRAPPPGVASPPAFLSRMASSGASATAYAGNQAGLLTGLSRMGTVFSTPHQTQTIRALSQAPGDPSAAAAATEPPPWSSPSPPSTPPLPPFGGGGGGGLRRMNSTSADAIAAEGFAAPVVAAAAAAVSPAAPPS
jgi:hypothetical protein